MSTGHPEKKVLKKEKKIIMWFQNFSNVSQPPGKILHYVNLSEQAVHHWPLSRINDDLLQRVNYNTPPAHVTAYPSTKSVVSGLSRLSFFESLFDIDKLITDPGRWPMLRSGQKPVTVMQDILRRLHKSSAMVPRPCLSADVRACLMEPRHL